MDWSIVIKSAVAGLAVAFFWGAWWLWWRLPKRQVYRLRLTIRDPKARAEVEDNIRKTISQLLGGAAVLIGAGFAYLQFVQQQQGARDLLISNQVAKGFEQLGSDKVVVRLGGIYALARPIREKPRMMPRTRAKFLATQAQKSPKSRHNPRDLECDEQLGGAQCARWT